MNCVACGRAMTPSGATQRCDCGSAWVPGAALLAMAEGMKGGFVTIPWQERKGDPRPCPACSAPMTLVQVEDVALDRCEQDGVWFDADELQRMLQHAPEFPEGGIPEGRYSDGRLANGFPLGGDPFNAVSSEASSSSGGVNWSRVGDALNTSSSYSTSHVGGTSLIEDVGVFFGSLFGLRR